jgi:hypothetical protein
MNELCESKTSIAPPQRLTEGPAKEEEKEQAVPELDCYYGPNGDYWIQDNRERWLSLPLASIRRHLRKAGFSDAKGPTGVSQLEEELIDIELSRNVEFAGALAGYSQGIHTVCGQKILVAVSPSPPVPVEGDSQLIQRWLLGMFGDEQALIVCGWLKSAIISLKAGDRRPGQSLAIAGPTGCGKSKFQSEIVTPLLGGRHCNPYAFMTSKSPFNAETFRAEHLACEDEQSSTKITDRNNFGAKLKALVSNDSAQYHQKHRDPLMFTPFWRVTISLNSGSEDLLVLPPIEGALAEKISLLQAREFDWPMPVETPEQFQVFLAEVRSQIPAFAWWLLNEFELPSKWYDRRYGVKAYHNTELLASLNELSPESQLLEIIDSELFKGFEPKVWKGTAANLQTRLLDSDAKYRVEKLIQYPSACGKYLNRLERRKPKRFKLGSKDGYTTYTISPPGEESLSGASGGESHQSLGIPQLL